jgi:hypothetical protein
MATLGLVEYKEASPEVKAVYDDIMATRKTDRMANETNRLAAGYQVEIDPQFKT